uniref:Protein hunchback n=2 Tax=Strigamia maritima TaxID=126957 RepID=T1JC63_STRMM
MFAPLSDAGVLVPPPSASSLGFQATLSVAMELERRLSVKLLENQQENGENSSKRSDGSPTELPRSSPALPTGGNAKNHEETCTTTDESLNESDHSSSCGEIGIINHQQDSTNNNNNNNIPPDYDDDDDDELNESSSNPLANAPILGFTWDEHVTSSKDEPRRSGKIKTYRCKQCSFMATTKTDFWEHSKTHIKAEKLLTCPKCPFVTEYKHHLEYHLRNHFGSKPFKCDQCTYSCVNKSMLNSHMKSHSNIYQFQCADCSYATKYCHSLKLHLRKYQHKAAHSSIDLNPNMDVFGNRKTRVKTKNNNDNNNQLMPSLPLPSLPQPPNFPFLYAMNGFHFGNGNGNGNGNGAEDCIPPLKCNLCDFTTPAQEHLGKHMLIHAATENKDLCSMYGINSDALIENKKVINGNHNNHNNTELLLNAGVRLFENSVFFGSSTAPLDLSNGNGRGRQNEQLPVSATRNRRKGKAFKLDRICLRLKQELPEENELLEEEEEVVSSSPSPPQVPRLVNANGKNNVKEEHSNGKEDYECSHCEIVFKNDVMYSVHMGFHGYHDPFQCNICGEITDDKVQFFLHIGRNAHL